MLKVEEKLDGENRHDKISIRSRRLHSLALSAFETGQMYIFLWHGVFEWRGLIQSRAIELKAQAFYNENV